MSSHWNHQLVAATLIWVLPKEQPRAQMENARPGWQDRDAFAPSRGRPVTMECGGGSLACEQRSILITM